MSDTLKQIKSDIKDAMRARDKVRLECLRGLVSEVKNAGIEKKGRGETSAEVDCPSEHISEDEVVKILQGVYKRRKEAAQMFVDGNRQDLADQDLAEVEVIDAYLPQAMDAAALEGLLREVISEVGAESIKEMGAVMKAAGPRIAGRADGRTVSEVVRQLLS